MKLIGLNRLLCEAGYARRWSFDYNNWKNDPQPQILKLGDWVHPTTGNYLIGGINLNYLSQKQILRLRYYLPDILKNRNLKERYWAGMELLPDIFDSAYRTYDRQHINIVTPSTLKFMTPAELQKLGRGGDADRLKARRDKLKDMATKRDRAVPPPEDVDISGPVEPELTKPAPVTKQGAPKSLRPELVKPGVVKPEVKPSAKPTTKPAPKSVEPAVKPVAKPGPVVEPAKPIKAKVAPVAKRAEPRKQEVPEVPQTKVEVEPEIEARPEAAPKRPPLKSKENMEKQAGKTAEAMRSKKLISRIDQRTGQPKPEEKKPEKPETPEIPLDDIELE